MPVLVQEQIAPSNPNADRKTVAGEVKGQRPQNQAFFPALDGLRWFAFTLVFLNHYISLPWAFGGVNIFFVLSGFLITGILLDTRQDQHRLRNFYVRRTLRIFPLFYAVVLAAVVTTPIFHWQWTMNWLAWPMYLGNFLCLFNQQSAVHGHEWMLASNGWLHAGRFLHHPIFCAALWSLCVEEQFYLVWPFLVYAVRSQKTLLRICVSACVLIPAARVAALAFAPTWMIEQKLLYRVTPFRVDSLLLGAAIALLWRSEHRATMLRLARIVAPVMATISLAYFGLTLHRFTLTGLDQYQMPSWAFTYGLLWIDIFAASLMLLCLTPGNRLFRFFSTASLRSLGKLTYGAYIFHDLIHTLLSNSLVRVCAGLPEIVTQALIVLIAYTVTFGLAWLSFRYVETPFLRLKDRYTIHNKPTLVPAPAATPQHLPLPLPLAA